MHSIGVGIVVQKRCARVLSVFDQLSRSVPYSRCRAVLDDMKGQFAITLFHHFATFENAMRHPRSVPLTRQLLRHLRLEQGGAAPQ